MHFNEPLRRSTLFHILEVRKVSERKSLQGLDNTAAEGTTAFQLGDVRCSKAWSLDITKRLDKAKWYLKTDYKVSIYRLQSISKHPYGIV